MEQDELFAARLVAGKAQAASPRACWWPRHARTMGRYVILTGGTTPNVLESVRATSILGCSEWDGYLPEKARGLMGRHVALEMALADAARSNNVEALDRIGKLLYDNAAEQARSLGCTIVEFPETRFKALLEAHVALFAEAVRLRKQGRPESSAFEARSQANMLGLAEFTSEWF